MSKYLITGFMLLALLAIVLFVVYGTAEEAAPAQPTGVEFDIDRSKPRPKMDAPKDNKPAPAKPAPRSKR